MSKYIIIFLATAISLIPVSKDSGVHGNTINQVVGAHAYAEPISQLKTKPIEPKVVKETTPKPKPVRTAQNKPVGNYGDPRSIARSLVSADQWPCLDKLWMKESNWSVSAYNASSGATGIPQSLPGNKMASHGSDWRTNPNTQIRWGLDYIKARYGTPCSAWAHSQANNWY